MKNYVSPAVGNVTEHSFLAVISSTIETKGASRVSGIETIKKHYNSPSVNSVANIDASFKFSSAVSNL